MDREGGPRTEGLFAAPSLPPPPLLPPSGGPALRALALRPLWRVVPRRNLGRCGFAGQCFAFLSVRCATRPTDTDRTKREKTGHTTRNTGSASRGRQEGAGATGGQAPLCTRFLAEARMRRSHSRLRSVSPRRLSVRILSKGRTTVRRLLSPLLRSSWSLASPSSLRRRTVAAVPQGQ
jgi:hypothetical protein